MESLEETLVPGKVVLVTFYTKNYTSRALRLRESAFKFGCDKVLMYNENSSDIVELRRQFPDIFKRTRGYGCMAWKAMVVNLALEGLNDNDILIYCDADLEVTSDLTPLLQLFRTRNLRHLFFYVGEHQTKNYREKFWTKRDVFVQLEADTSEFHDQYQIMSGFSLWRSGLKFNHLAKNWLSLSVKEHLICDDAPNKLGKENIEGFQAHRHDQSILSVLVRKLDDTDTNILRDPTQFGENDSVEGASLSDYPTLVRNHGVAGETVPVNLPQVTVITPTIGHQFMRRAVESVQNQTYPNIEHVLVIDKPGDSEEVLNYVKELNGSRRTLRSAVLPYNTGANRWNGHRVYAAFPHLLHHADWIVYLDEDNWFEPQHIQSLVNLVTKNNLHWAFSLRRIVNQEGEFVCNDNCESLGPLHPVFNNPDDRLIDTSCYFLKREIAQQVSMVWNKPTRPPGNLPEPDRQLSKVLCDQVQNFGCTLQYTLNYTTSNREDSVNSYFFLYGNQMMAKKYPNGLPWNKSAGPSEPKVKEVSELEAKAIQAVENENQPSAGKILGSIVDGKPVLYVCHFTKEATDAYFKIQQLRKTGNLKESVAYKEWQMTLLDTVGEHYYLVDGYRTEIPPGATLLVHICLPQCLPLKTLQRTDITKIGYTLEGPNIRHQQQWQQSFLAHFFDRILTYWTPLLENCSKPESKPRAYWCPYIHRINFDDPLDRTWIKENKNFEKSVVMILEYRELKGTYKIDNTELHCLDPLRGECAKAMQKFITVYGQGWDSFKEKEKLDHLKIGHTIGKFKDPRPNVEIIKDFTFNLIIENCDGSDYVSEKFCDALVAGAIPIYWGNIGPRMRKLIPDDIYIDGKHYGTAERLAKTINTIGVKEINRIKRALNAKRESVLRALSPDYYYECVKQAIDET